MPTPGLLRIGLPFLGFFSRGQKREAPSGYFTADSRDWAYAPKRGKWKRRAGSAIKGDTLSGGPPTHETTGVLPAKWSAVGRQMFEMTSSSLADGNPTVAGLWTNESGIWGQLAWWNTNGTPAWQSIGARLFVAGAPTTPLDYPVNGDVSTTIKFRMPPIWSANGITYSRCADEKSRRLLFPGTRQGIQIGDWYCAPNQQGTPYRFNQRFSDGFYGTGTETYWPMGHMPPLMLPVITIPAASTNTYESWSSEDRFIFTIAYRFEDGSIGLPFIPRTPDQVAIDGSLAVPQNRAGWVTKLDAIGGKKYSYITWTQIPAGPPGTISRILLRTPKVASPALPSIYTQVNGVTTLQLGIVAEIPNNDPTTSYVDHNGNDASLFVDPINIRFADHKWPRRGRSFFTFDGHVAVGGKLQPNPACILVSVPDPGDGYNPVVQAVAVRNDQIAVPRVDKVLIASIDNNYPTAGIPLTAALTLQGLCDTILGSRAATTDITYHNWTAQLVPGANLRMTCDKLDYTQVYANFSTIIGNATITIQNGTDLNPGNLTGIALRMKIGGVGIPNNTYVGAIHATTLDMVDANGAAVTATATNGPPGVPLKIGWDTADISNRPGEVRCFSSFHPVILYSSTYAQSSVDERAVDFTGADPGHPRYASNSWYALNTRTVPARAGRFMGGGEIKNGAVVYYSRGKAFMTNIRAGKTGADADWSLQLSVGSRGAISSSVVQGNQCVVALTAEGVEVTDENGSVIISGAIYDPGENTGEWAYEIRQCRIGATTGSDAGRWSMDIATGKLRVSYRHDGTADYPDRYMVYDFTASEGQSGLAGMLMPDGKPYGWSCPHRVAVGPMCEVQDSTSPYVHSYGIRDSNAGTGDGRVQEFETGTTDDGAPVTPIGYHSMLLDEDELQEFSVKEVRALYKKNGTGFRIGLSRDKNRTGGNVDAFTMDSSTTDEFKIARLPANQEMLTSKECVEFWFDDDGISSAPEIEGMQVVVDKLANVAARR